MAQRCLTLNANILSWCLPCSEHCFGHSNQMLVLHEGRWSLKLINPAGDVMMCIIIHPVAVKSKTSGTWSCCWNWRESQRIKFIRIHYLGPQDPWQANRKLLRYCCVDHSSGFQHVNDVLASLCVRDDKSNIKHCWVKTITVNRCCLHMKLILLWTFAVNKPGGDQHRWSQ